MVRCVELSDQVSQETLDEWTEPLESFVGRRVPQKNRLDNNFLILTNVCVCTFSKEVKPVPVRGDLFHGDLYMNYMKVFHVISG